MGSISSQFRPLGRRGSQTDDFDSPEVKWVKNKQPGSPQNSIVVNSYMDINREKGGAFNSAGRLPIF
jgi:hypothetical protein